MKYLFLSCLFIAGCSQKKSMPTLHNYPMLDPHNCPLPTDDYDDSNLKAQAKSLNMRYVDYLHFVNNKKNEEVLVLGE